MTAIQPVTCRTADELLDALHPRRGSWPHRFGPTYFRGHGNSQWELLPSAFRATSWNPFANVDPDLGIDPYWIGDWERNIITMFCSELDRAGMQIPGGIYFNRPETYSEVGETWPEPALEPVLALAQHLGVPTRFLDWTSSRKVAAYFAAVEALKLKSEFLDIWALDSGLVDLLGEELSHLKCRIVRTNRFGNDNLHAQSGIFTVCWGAIADGSRFIPLDEAFLESNVSAVLEQLPSLQGRSPLARFQLPTSEARTLLEELALDGIDGLNLFPGYVGVMRALHEQKVVSPDDVLSMPQRKHS